MEMPFIPKERQSLHNKDRLELVSRAKINLTLEVLFRRYDGYHELRSVMQSLDLSDHLTLKNVTDTNQIQLFCSHRELPRDESNLAVKAALLIQQEFAPEKGVIIELVKNIPIAAGLGGGSGNAAAVLGGLNKLWGLKLDHLALLQLASRLGSDVPFFINEGTALAEGRGERLTPLPSFPPCYVLLAAPDGAKLSAGEVYNHLLLDKIPKKPLTDLFVEALNRAYQNDEDRLADLQGLFTNHLEGAVFSLDPRVERLKSQIIKEGLPALVSGSGPTVFTVLNEPGVLQQLADQLIAQGYTAIVTKTAQKKERNKKGDTP